MFENCHFFQPCDHEVAKTKKNAIFFKVIVCQRITKTTTEKNIEKAHENARKT